MLGLRLGALTACLLNNRFFEHLLKFGQIGQRLIHQQIRPRFADDRFFFLRRELVGSHQHDGRVLQNGALAKPAANRWTADIPR